MSVLKHIVRQPFVVATGFAALVHSTWALGTLFAGTQPEGWHLVGWLAPALLIAFALDIGQIATSGEIREHGLSVGRAVTFGVFALATYYLQWLYIAHHMPALEIAAGVSATAKATAVYMRDAALWVIPAFLPLSTVLYTFSGKTAPRMEEKSTEIQVIPVIPSEPLPMEETKALPFGSAVPAQDENPSEGEMLNIGMIENGGEPITTANGHGRKTTRIRGKK